MKLVTAAAMGVCVTAVMALAQTKPVAPAPPASPANVQQTVPIMLPGSPMQRSTPAANPSVSEFVGMPGTPERLRQINMIESEKLSKQKSHNLPKPEAFWHDYNPNAEVQKPAK